MIYFIILILVSILISTFFNEGEESFAPPITEYVDIFYYINLDDREDRNSQFLGQMDEVGIPQNKIQRISGIYEKDHGHIGCTKSHIKTLKTFIASSNKICIIFEDDFEWLGSPNALFADFFAEKIPFDVCMLSGSYAKATRTKWPFLVKVDDAQTTSGYMVTREFAPILLKNFEDGLQLLERNYDHPKYAVDQYWKKLQVIAEWYIFSPKLGKQISSVSDIQGGYVEMPV